MIFQNDVRIRSGKLNHPTVADISVQWLLQAYLSSMQKEGRNVYIFPISVSYERLFEIKNIADAMVSGEQKSFGIAEMFKKINAYKGHKLGRCYVKFGQTISLREYCSSSDFGVLSAKNINEAALNLTE